MPHSTIHDPAPQKEVYNGTERFTVHTSSPVIYGTTQGEHTTGRCNWCCREGGAPLAGPYDNL